MIDGLVLILVVVVHTVVTMLLGGYLVWRRYESAVDNVNKRLNQHALRLYKRVILMQEKVSEANGNDVVIAPELYSSIHYIINETLEVTDDILAELKL